jgi:hypothetical protein
MVSNMGNNKSNNFMKTNMLNAILAVVTLGVITLIAANRGADGKYELLPIIVSYGAVAVLASLAVSDNRRGVKPYSAR